MTKDTKEGHCCSTKKDNCCLGSKIGTCLSDKGCDAYVAGVLFALGMNFAQSGWSVALLWSLLSWADAGYLLVQLLSKTPQ